MIWQTHFFRPSSPVESFEIYNVASVKYILNYFSEFINRVT